MVIDLSHDFFFICLYHSLNEINICFLIRKKSTTPLTIEKTIKYGIRLKFFQSVKWCILAGTRTAVVLIYKNAMNFSVVSEPVFAKWTFVLPFGEFSCKMLNIEIQHFTKSEGQITLNNIQYYLHINYTCLRTIDLSHPT